MMRKKRKHMKIRPVESKNLVALKKEREITIADMPPRGPQALENQVVGLFQKGEITAWCFRIPDMRWRHTDRS